MGCRVIMLPWFTIVFALGVLQLPGGHADAADVLTQHYNNGRTGANLSETTLSRNTLRSGTFGKLWTLYADGQIVEHWNCVDRLGLLAQLGAFPPPTADAG